ncbi:hypothetical protein AX15_007055 [Amanita polypyramis BW_CC]|nr:hypothetical protein AX15_007055 [Amanita polypyramis BW_CC]
MVPTPVAPSPAPATRRAGNTTITQTNTGAGLSRPEDEEVKPYVIVTVIGKGSFATVYKGYHEETRRQVAIKTVKRDILTAKLFDNLQSEIQILKSLSHRHITKLIDIVRAERNIYLIMEYCAGGDLTNYIKKRGRVEGLEYAPSPGAPPQYYPHPRMGGLNEIVVRSFLRQLARALKFLRNRNLIHRDIKPQNLLLNPASTDELARGHPLGVPMLKIADFGFARSLPNAMMAETLCGSPLYMAPEILRYEKYDAKADLWSVGAVLYEMSVGKPPFRAMNHIELLKKIEQAKAIKFPDEDHGTHTAANSTNGGSDTIPVPDDVKKLIRALLKRNPVERASFDEFFGSTALAKSKFPRPPELSPVRQLSEVSTVDGAGAVEQEWTGRPPTPEHHKIIPPEVLDPKAMIPPSKFNFRRPHVTDEVTTGGKTDVNGNNKNEAVVEHRVITPLTPPATTDKARRYSMPGYVPEGRRTTGPLSTEGSIIPGETEEDGMLRREYVLVGDTRAVEFNRAVDEITAHPRRPLQDRHITFPPPPNVNIPPLSSSPSSVASRAASNALNRALSIASKTLFGSQGHPRASPSREHHLHHNVGAPSSPRRPQIIALDRNGERDPIEDNLLAQLEDLAQKTDVLTHWADEMYEYVKAVPQKPLPDPAKFVKREGEPEKHARRRKHADMEAEYNAVTCIAVYMLLMSFSQKGIDKLWHYQEHLKMRHPDGDFVVSEGFHVALTWFKEHFIKCNDRAELVKTWLPAQYEGPKSWLDQLVYDRALLLVRCYTNSSALRLKRD